MNEGGVTQELIPYSRRKDLSLEFSFVQFLPTRFKAIRSPKERVCLHYLWHLQIVKDDLHSAISIFNLPLRVEKLIVIDRDKQRKTQ